MPSHEPSATALLLAGLGLLLGVSALASRAAPRLGVPVALLFLGVGMLAGSDGVLGIAFEDYALTFRFGTAALVLILFDGGLNTPLSAVKEGLWPAAAVATFGVLGTTALTGVAAHALGFPWSQAFLLGAIVSSTDAAAVFSVLRGSGVHLARRVGVTLELESGLNDPMAVILTTALTAVAVGGEALGPALGLRALLEMALGAAFGLAFGFGGRWLLRRVRLPAAGLYPVVTLALAFLAFGVPTLAHGSGFLAVYLAAMLLGAEAIRYRTGVLRVHDALAWLAQVLMFLVLGLLVFPSHLPDVAPQGLALGLWLALVARPLVVLLCLLPFGFSAKEALYVGWVGLRGAVPIILATVPVLASVPGAQRLFDVVFFVVVVNAIVPGATVGWVTRKLGLQSAAPPPPTAALEISSTQLVNGALRTYYLTPEAAVVGATLAELPFPPSAAVTLIVRGDALIAPKGATTLQAGDHVTVFSHQEDAPLMQLIFGLADDH